MTITHNDFNILILFCLIKHYPLIRATFSHSHTVSATVREDMFLFDFLLLPYVSLYFLNAKTASGIFANIALTKRQACDSMSAIEKVLSRVFSKQLLGPLLQELRPYGQPGPLPIGGFALPY